MKGLHQMKRSALRLLPLLLLVASLFNTNILASRAEKPALNAQDCVTECGKKRDAMLENCSRLAGANRTRCETTANTQYNKCTEGCGNNAAKP